MKQLLIAWIAVGLLASCAKKGEKDPAELVVAAYSLPRTFKDQLLEKLGEKKQDHKGIVSLLKSAGIEFEKGTDTVWNPSGRLYLVNKKSEILKIEELIKQMQIEVHDVTEEYVRHLEEMKFRIPVKEKSSPF